MNSNTSWVVRQFAENEPLGSKRTHFHVIENDGSFVADCTGPSLTQREKHAANARLIAAAPDLLAALSDLLEIAQNRWRSLPIDTPEKQRIAAARAAIAKVRA